MHDTSQYDPFQDLATNWPGWTVQFGKFHELADEVIDGRTKIMVLDAGEDDDRVWALAHAIAHLRLGHYVKPTGFTASVEFTSPKQEQDANDLADLWLTSWSGLEETPIQRRPLEGNPA